ncbi:hypothetical protein M514_22205 [Trichuris suis]|uniref:Uncharacterized protein n=1 Tax=Trichuris suis TaxID=68888 RepID=A0A085N814_9BILA|nr:hypothetical protein M514_22205 [Trichuris suis]
MERQYEDADANSPGHPGLNWEPLDLQSNALPLSYTPYGFLLEQLNLRTSMKHDDKQSSFLAVKKASIDLRDVSSINTMSCIDNSLPSKWNTFSGKSTGQFDKGHHQEGVLSAALSREDPYFMVIRGHPGLNWGPLDLQSNALPLSYTPDVVCIYQCEASTCFSEVALSIFTVIYAEDRTVLFHAGSTGQFVYFLNCSFVFTVKLYPLKDYVSQKSQTR